MNVIAIIVYALLITQAGLILEGLVSYARSKHRRR